MQVDDEAAVYTALKGNAQPEKEAMVITTLLKLRTKTPPSSPTLPSRRKVSRELYPKGSTPQINVMPARASARPPPLPPQPVPQPRTPSFASANAQDVATPLQKFERACDFVCSKFDTEVQRMSLVCATFIATCCSSPRDVGLFLQHYLESVFAVKILTVPAFATQHSTPQAIYELSIRVVRLHSYADQFSMHFRKLNWRHTFIFTRNFNRWLAELDLSAQINQQNFSLMPQVLRNTYAEAVRSCPEMRPTKASVTEYLTQLDMLQPNKVVLQLQQPPPPVVASSAPSVIVPLARRGKSIALTPQ